MTSNVANNVSHYQQPYATYAQQSAYPPHQKKPSFLPNNSPYDDFVHNGSSPTLSARDPNAYIQTLRSSRSSSRSDLHLQEAAAAAVVTTAAAATTAISQGAAATVSRQKSMKDFSVKQVAREIVIDQNKRKADQYDDPSSSARCRDASSHSSQAQQKTIDAAASVAKSYVKQGSTQVYQAGFISVEDSCAVFEKYVVHGTSTMVSFIGCRIDARFINALIQALNHTTHVVELDLTSNAIDDRAAYFLAMHLRSERNLRVLNLADNPIGESGIKFLNDAVAQNLHKITLIGLGKKNREFVDQ